MNHCETGRTELREQILKTFHEAYSSQHEGAPAPEITDDTILLESGLDSLGLAIVVTRLEEELGYDPFSLSPDAYYPRTFGEFVDFYHGNRPQ
jgi:acyl carrier protein